MKADRIILGEGKNCIFDLDTEKNQLNNNLIVCGSSGSGKTMSITEMKLLETFNSSLIVTLSKRRLIDKYTPLFKSRGYKVLDLNFTNPEKSLISYDPLHYVKSKLDIIYLAESIVKADPQKKLSYADPYWDQCATSLLTAEIALALEMNKKATFNDVIKIHNKLEFVEEDEGITTTLDKIFEKVAECDPLNVAVTSWKTFRKLPRKTAGCVYSTLNTTLDTIFTPEIRRMIARHYKIDFQNIADEKTLLFVSTSAVNPSLHYFVNNFYAQAIKSLFEYAENRPDLDYKLPRETHIICDDFAMSKILNFSEYISIFREKNISVTLLIQSEAQLKTIYGDDAEIIKDNCDSYVFFGSNNLMTARNISEKLNVSVEKILYMPLEKVIIFRRGHKPIISERYDITKNELYKEVTAAHKKLLRLKQIAK